MSTEFFGEVVGHRRFVRCVAKDQYKSADCLRARHQADGNSFGRALVTGGQAGGHRLGGDPQLRAGVSGSDPPALRRSGIALTRR